MCFHSCAGFGVHTFKLVTQEGKETYIKWHWISKQGAQHLDSLHFPHHPPLRMLCGSVCFVWIDWPLAMRPAMQLTLFATTYTCSLRDIPTAYRSDDHNLTITSGAHS